MSTPDERAGEHPVFVPPRARTLLFLAVCALGVSAVITQLTLMRELVAVFSGNELVFGIVLGNWMLLTGIGSALGRTAARLKSPLALLVAAQILVAVLPIGDVFLLRSLRNVVFLRGEEVGVSETVVTCFVVLAPYCLTTGYLLTLACLVLASRRDASSIGQVYFLDVIGDVMGGLLFSFVLIYALNLDHFRILYLPAVLNLVFAALLAARFKRPILLALTAAVTAGLVGLIGAYDLDKLSTRIEYAGQNVVCRGNSPYGSLVVTESSGQYNFIFNGVMLFSTHDVEQAEETVHYAMAQRPDARRVLLISGGVSGTAREILKYGVAAVDYVELDPLIISTARRYLAEGTGAAPTAASLDDPRIRVVNTDGRLFVKQTPWRYDVVIVDVPNPCTSQINRFYTLEFFREVKRVLAPRGVLSFTLGEYHNSLYPELVRLIAAGHHTLRKVFRRVSVIPDDRSGRIFFLASDGSLTRDVAAQIEQKGIRTALIGRDYLKGVFTPTRMAHMRQAVAQDAPVNEDFNPILYYYYLRLWMSQFKVRFGLLEGLLLLILVLYLVRVRPVTLAVFTTGFAASALEVVLLVGFQILYGCVYRQVGLIVTMFMAGLGIGSFVINRMPRRFRRKDLARLEWAVAVYAGGLPLVLLALGGLGGVAAAVASQVVIPLLSLLLAVLVGMEFPLAGSIAMATSKSPSAERHGPRAVTSTAARLYTADYIGAALGALLVSTLLIPVVGLVAVCLLAAGLNIVSGAVLAVTSRN